MLKVEKGKLRELSTRCGSQYMIYGFINWWLRTLINDTYMAKTKRVDSRPNKSLYTESV